MSKRCKDCKNYNKPFLYGFRGCVFQKICDAHDKAMYDPKYYVKFMLWRAE